MKAIRIFLLVLIVIGLGLIATYTIWVPTLVTAILQSEGVNREPAAPSMPFGSATTSQPVPPLQHTQMVTLGIGNTGYSNGVKITLNTVSEDNRCPEGVTCIQAGSVLANITLRSNTHVETINLASNKVALF